MLKLESSCSARSSSEARAIVSPVMAADFLSRKVTFELNQFYCGHPLPLTEEPHKFIYRHIHEYTQKIEDDLKAIGEWDCQRYSKHARLLPSVR